MILFSGILVLFSGVVVVGKGSAGSVSIYITGVDSGGYVSIMKMDVMEVVMAGGGGKTAAVMGVGVQAVMFIKVFY